MMESSPNTLVSRSDTLDCAAYPQLMGVLNVTPDSFSDGGLYIDPQKAVDRAIKMASEGASIIDIGGASSRPKGAAYGSGATLISSDEEMSRILPVVERLSRERPDIWISIDTFRSDVAQEALSKGAHLINDITALRFDPAVADVCASFSAPLMLMHSVGLPGEMPHLLNHIDVTELVKSELASACRQAQAAGCTQLIVDPGFGFGKTTEDNLQLIRELDSLAELGFPIAIGVSRKSSVGALMQRNAENELSPHDRLPGSLALSAVAVSHGARIVRTHDVAKTASFLRVYIAASHP